MVTSCTQTVNEKYVVMYINEADADNIVHKLMQLKYVHDIQGSPYKYLKTYEKKT